MSFQRLLRDDSNYLGQLPRRPAKELSSITVEPWRAGRKGVRIEVVADGIDYPLPVVLSRDAARWLRDALSKELYGEW